MHSGQAWIVSGLSLAVSYAIAALTPLNQWVGFWLRGSFYTVYQVMLLGALLPCGALLTIHYHKRSPSLLAMTLWGTALGYPAGLVALLLHPLTQPDGIHLFVESLRIRAPEAVIATLWFPIKLLSWIYEAMLGLLIPAVVTSRRRRADILLVGSPGYAILVWSVIVSRTRHGRLRA